MESKIMSERTVHLNKDIESEWDLWIQLLKFTGYKVAKTMCQREPPYALAFQILSPIEVALGKKLNQLINEIFPNGDLEWNSWKFDGSTGVLDLMHVVRMEEE